MRTAQIAWFVSFIGLLATLAFLQFGAPDMMPMQFGLDGQPVRMASHTDYFLFAYGFSMFMNLVFGLSSTRYAFKVIPPRLWNIPHKDYWLAPERGAQGLDRIASLMAWAGVATNLTMAFIFMVVGAQATGAISGDAVNMIVIAVVLASFTSPVAAYRYMKPPAR